MSVPVSDKQIKAMCKTKIVGVVGDGPKVYSWNPLKPLGLDDNAARKTLEEWVGFLRYKDTSVNPNVNKIHGWLIKRHDRHSTLGGGCENFDPTYDIWAFYGFKVGDQTSNSEDDFNAIIDNVCSAFNSDQVVTVNGKTLAHEGLNFPILSLIRAGEEAYHFAAGQIKFLFSN